MPAYRNALCGFAVCIAVAIGGCADIAVRKVSPPDLLDDWKASVLAAGELSPRTRQTLRRYDLEQLYRRAPDEAAQRLHCEALTDPQPDLLFALAEMSYLRGTQAEKWSCRDAIGHYYLAAGYAFHYLFATAEDDKGDTRSLSPRDAFDPRFRLACELYNAGLAKCIRAAQRSGRLDPRQELRLPCGEGEAFVLSVVHEGFAWKPDEFGPLQFCEDYEVLGLANQYRTYGLGVPLIGTRAGAEKGKADIYPTAVNFPVTAFFRFEGTLADLGARRVGRLELINPLTFGAVSARGRSVPLETDLTTPNAYFLAHTDLRGLEYTGFLRGDKVLAKTGLHLLQPYQPGKIPVVMVHGLLSSPLTWAPLCNDLQADPAVRDKYQFWLYFYPTANPYLATAADLRQRLAKLRAELDPQGKDTALDQMVFLGHSMGGLVSRLLTVDSGDDFWGQVSDKPFDGLRLHPDTRDELRSIFFFPREPCVRRVVFLGTPHHGSRLSPTYAARLVTSFARLPKTLLAVAKDVTEENPDLPLKLRAGHIPTSVELLAPHAPALELLAAKPRAEPVHYHSIIGVVPESRFDVEGLLTGFAKPEEGDGVVPYKSAHLEGVDSELVVPADHMHVHHHPLAVREVRRILLEHVKSLETIKLVSQEAVSKGR